MSDHENQPTRKGKIARLPASIREELNCRIHDGETAHRIIAWLHSLPEVLAVLDQEGEEPITNQNLSVWRSGGYADWLRRRDRVEQTKVLSQYAFELAKAAGASVSDGAAAILGGRILEAVESLSESEEGEQKLVGFAMAMSKLRDADSKMLRARVAQRSADQKDRQLDLDEQKFQRTTAKLFLKWAASEEARTILGSGETESVQMDKLVQLFFGTAPDLQPPSIP